jgi:hypothetical protein
MAKLEAPVVISANCLISGAVVYLSSEHKWLEGLASAHIFDDLNGANAAGKTAADPARVIGVELVPVKQGGGAIEPRHYREAIRASGPGRYVFPLGSGGDNVSI